MKKRLCAAVLGALLVACGESLTDAQYLEKAQTHYDQGDIKSAVIEAKNALKTNPKNGQARVLLGRLQLLSGDAGAAEKEFGMAAKLGVPTEVFQAELSKALLLQGKRDQLRSLSDNNLGGPDKAEFLANKALAFLSDNDVGQATLLIDEALAISSDSIPALLAKARLHLVKQELVQARSVLERVKSIDEKNSVVWSLLGDVERQAGNHELAVQALSQAMELGGQTPSELLRRADSLINLKRIEAAQKDVNILLESSPNSPMVNYASARLLMLKNMPDEAQVAFEKIIRVRADFAPALYPLAMIHYQKGNLERAEQYANKFKNQQPESIEGQRLLAMVLYRNQKYSEAESELRNLLSAKPDDLAAINLLASTLYHLGKKQESLALLEKIAANFPDSAYAQLRLGAGMLSAGEKTEAEARMEQAMALDPEFHQADVILVLHHLQQKEFDRALAVATAYRDKSPKSALPYSLMGHAYMGKQALADAREAFSGALQLQADDLVSNNAMAYMAIRDKKLDEAREYYQSILAGRKNHLQTLMRLALLDAMENKPESMLARLQQAMDAHPGSLSPRLAIARYRMTQQQADKVPMLFQGVENSANKNADVLAILGAAYLAEQEFTSAKHNLLRLVELRPDSAKVQYMLAQAYAGEKDMGKMEVALDKALELRPDYFAARLALSRHLINTNVEKARGHIEALTKSAPDHDQVKQLYGELQNKLGDPNKALEAYQQAFNDNPTTKSMVFLVRQHAKMGNTTQSVELLESWLQEHSDDVAARMLLANGYIALNKPGDVVTAEYQKILDLQPKNVLAMNNLAWYLKDADANKALVYAKEAHQLRPESPIILDTLAVLELKNGHVDEAHQAIQRALKKAPENPTMIYHAALIEKSLGKNLAAYERLNNLLQEGEDFDLRDEALQLLESLK